MGGSSSAISSSDRERFESKIDVSGGIDACWIWVGTRDQVGYGVFWLRRRNWKAHRVAWLLAGGMIPDGLCICHTCDVCWCVNPAHLWLGTGVENTADKVAKGRQSKGDAHRRSLVNRARGERQGLARLNEDLVREIRASELSSTELARRLGVGLSTVANVRRGNTWRHVV